MKYRVKRKLLILFSLFTLLKLFSQEVVVINKTGFDIYNVYISPSGLEQWSEDLQPFDVILKDRYKIIDVSAYDETYFDFRFIDIDGDEYIKKNVDLKLHRKVVVSLDDLAYVMDRIKEDFSDEWFVSIRNNTGVSIVELYISPHNSNSWGTNLMENDYMENKSTEQISMGGGVESIDYDIRMDSSEGAVFIKENIPLNNNVTVVITSSDRE
ncbi:MAG: hypothetical protein JEY91_00435 [Spirochaetaceae bacterium]|nr:hypothetical protein [Spirochaetaceae bacterium]